MSRFIQILGYCMLATLASSSMAADRETGSGWQKSFGDVTSLGYRVADQRISYGPSTEQFVDLWIPEGDSPAPVIALVHGGCWLAEYDITHIRPLATALAERGYAVWAIEYRRVGQEGGGWPGTFQDIAEAMDLLPAFQDSRIDTGRAVVAGHSAGGHLALWAAGRSQLDSDSELYRPSPFIPNGAIGLAAITDLEAYADGENNCQQVTSRLMGGSPVEKPGRYQQASPAWLGSETMVSLLQGDEDRIVPPGQARRMKGARPVILEGAGHFDLIHPETQAFPTLLELLHGMTER